MTNSVKKGCLFVIAGPSGVGKGTLVSMLREKYPQIGFSVSATTRKPRQGESDGVQYFFLTREDFEKRIQAGEFLEWAEFSGNLYGTNKNFVQKILDEGKSIILEIEVQGAVQVKSKVPESVLIFIKPPSFEELKNRLVKRSTETEAEVEKRLAQVKRELEQAHEFNYVMVNDDLDKAFAELEKIVLNEIEKANV